MKRFATASALALTIGFAAPLAAQDMDDQNIVDTVKNVIHQLDPNFAFPAELTNDQYLQLNGIISNTDDQEDKVRFAKFYIDEEMGVEGSAEISEQQIDGIKTQVSQFDSEIVLPAMTSEEWLKLGSIVNASSGEANGVRSQAVKVFLADAMGTDTSAPVSENLKSSVMFDLAKNDIDAPVPAMTGDQWVELRVILNEGENSSKDQTKEAVEAFFASL